MTNWVEIAGFELLLCIAYLVGLTAERLIKGAWLPIHSEHVELDHMRLTINGIPIEMLYGPDAVRHPYKLSEPVDFLFDEPIVPAPPGGYFNADRAAFLMERHIAAMTAKPCSPFGLINGC